MNFGISPALKKAFPLITSVNRPEVLKKEQLISDPNWLAGFISAEGCFFIDIKKSQSTKLGKTVQLRFILVQHTRDEKLMRSLAEYLGCGNIYKSRESFSLKVSKLDDLASKVLPFCRNYPVLGVKAQDFEDFSTVVDMIKAKKHLTEEGLEEINKIKEGMNKGRK